MTIISKVFTHRCGRMAIFDVFRLLPYFDKAEQLLFNFKKEESR